MEESKKFSAEPWNIKCFTSSFARMIQLFRILTDALDFSQPFRVEIEYDPEQPRTSVKTYMPNKVLESYIQRELENCKD